MKFKYLSDKAKCVAVSDYVLGFYATHDDDDGFSGADAYDILNDGDDEFNRDGTFLSDEDIEGDE